jgi:ABC-2 type transport system permease protein
LKFKNKKRETQNKINNKKMRSFYRQLVHIFIHTREELSFIFRDPAIILIFIIANIAYPILYSIAYSNEQIKEVEMAVVDLDKSQSSRQFCRMIDATEGLKNTLFTGDLGEAKEQFYSGKVKGIVLIPDDFEKSIFSGAQAHVGIYADASYFLIYKQVYSSIVSVSQTFSAGIQLKKGLAKGNSYAQAIKNLSPVKLKTVELFNPSSAYGSFVMPSIILVILQQTLLIGIGILGGTRKEIQRYNASNSVQSEKHKIVPFILGKSFAYFIIFMIIGAFNLIWINHWFGYPDKSTNIAILSLYIPYIIANIFLGMAISVFFKHRENAMLFMVFLSIPVLFLSGATWPAEAIPVFLRKIAMIFPSTFMVSAFQRVRTMGVGIEYVRSAIYAMLIQSALYFVLAYFAFKHILHLLQNLENKKEKQVKVQNLQETK